MQFKYKSLRKLKIFRKIYILIVYNHTLKVNNMLTKNEKTVLRLLMANFDTDYSINQIARECSLAPNGALKILKKFKKEGILKTKSIANIISYKINFEDEKTNAVLELALIPELDNKLKYRLNDLKGLKEITKSCILFGSYIKSNKPHDLDVLFILDNYKEYKKKIASVRDITPVKIHDVLQTEQDLKKNIINKDKVILEILKKGVILWGQKIIIKVIKDVCSRKTEKML